MWLLWVNFCTVVAVWTLPEYIWPTRVLRWDMIVPHRAHTLHVSHLHSILGSQQQANPLLPTEWHVKMLFCLFWGFFSVFHNIFNSAIFSLFVLYGEWILSVVLPLEKREGGKSFKSKGWHDCGAPSLSGSLLSRCDILSNFKLFVFFNWVDAKLRICN